MDWRGLVVVEANEVPLRVVEDLAPSGRIPFLAQLLEQGTLVETEVDEVLSKELYPSQTWASLSTGVPWSEHGIYWYGDHKPLEYPLYWQIAAREGRSVGLVNTLHSSPLGAQCSVGDFRFVIPDCFAADDDARPADYRRFQRANLSLTAANSRRVDRRPNPADLLGLARSLPHLGLRPRTLGQLGGLVASAAIGRVPRERIRGAQFLVLQDLFLHLLGRHRPDLAVVFTNHVAAAMHRYWYAFRPEDFERNHYGPDWVERYRDEIPVAMELLDRFLVDLARWCEADDRTLVVVSSMGQGPSDRLDATAEHEAVIVDGVRFLAALGIADDGVRVVGSMNPQLTVDVDGEERAVELAERLTVVGEGGALLDVDRSGTVVTLTHRLEVIDQSTVVVDGAPVRATSVGVEIHPVDDHSSGRHIARGILAVANSPSFKAPVDAVVSNLDVAPALLDHLGVRRPDHHRSPRFCVSDRSPQPAADVVAWTPRPGWRNWQTQRA